MEFSWKPLPSTAVNGMPSALKLPFVMFSLIYPTVEQVNNYE